MAHANYTDRQLIAMGIKNPKAAMARAKEAEKALRALDKMGLEVFGGSGNCTLRVTGEQVVDKRSAAFDLTGFHADGGDGGDSEARFDDYFQSIDAIEDQTGRVW